MFALFYLRPSDSDLTEFGPSAVERPHTVTLEGEGTFRVIQETLTEVLIMEGKTYLSFEGSCHRVEIGLLSAHKIVIIPG